MENTKNTIILDFSSTNIPQPYESKNTSDSTYVSWGTNNQFPNFLIELYNTSAVHSAIINQKTTYIIGGGIKVGEEPKDIMVNPSDSLVEFTSKCIKDYILFNAFAVEVVFNVFNEPIEYHHIPMQRLRLNKSKTKFFYNEDWVLSRKHIQYDRYNPKDNQTTTSKVFYFDGYFPSLNVVYSTPEYAASIKSIVTDASIAEFHLNNIKNHFSPSTIITFFNGQNVSEAVKQQVVRDLEQKYRGESGAKIIVDFQHKDGQAADIKQLSASDWDKAYVEIYARNIENIMYGHTVGSPSLFGVLKAGSLGSNQELETAYEIFKKNYVSVKRGEIETALNQLFTNFTEIGGQKVSFIDKPLFSTRLSDSIKEKIYTIDELRELDGKEPLPNGQGARLLSDSQPQVQPVQPVQQSEQSEQPEDVKKKSNSKSLTEEDYELIKDLGAAFEEFEVIEEVNHFQFDKQSDVADFIINNDIKGLKIDELQQLLKDKKIDVTQNQLDAILKDLTKSGVISYEEDKDGRIRIKPLPEPNVPDSNRVLTMYKYIKRPEVSGEDLLPTSRSFCVKLIDNKRLYTREEIQRMSEIFGYDVFRFCGGWYYNPDTDETTSHCRHQWQQLKVTRRTQQ